MYVLPDLLDGVLWGPNRPVEDAAYQGSTALLTLAEHHKGRVLLQHTHAILANSHIQSLGLTYAQLQLSINVFIHEIEGGPATEAHAGHVPKQCHTFTVLLNHTHDAQGDWHWLRVAGLKT